jgi:hypothetical protein
MASGQWPPKQAEYMTAPDPIAATSDSSCTAGAVHTWHFGQLLLRQLLNATTSCAQPSQRATWPPSAAVRQRSIADIAFSWPRLTWPALARRQAAPCSRKMSATSSPGRATAAGVYRDAFFPRDLVVFGLAPLPASLSIGLATAAMMPVATRV